MLLPHRCYHLYQLYYQHHNSRKLFFFNGIIYLFPPFYNNPTDHFKSPLISTNIPKDVSHVIVGGKGRKLHKISSTNFVPLRDPVDLEERIRSIHTLPAAIAANEPDASSFAVAIGTGSNTAHILNSDNLKPTMEVVRTRSIRCLRYHPSLPVLAIGDGSGKVVIVDLLEERELAEFSSPEGLRINFIDFSNKGDFLAVATDGGGFVYETSVSVFISILFLYVPCPHRGIYRGIHYVEMLIYYPI